MPTTSAAQAIQDFLGGGIGGPTLLRTILGEHHWVVPATEGGAVELVGDAETGSRLALFTSEQRLRAWRQRRVQAAQGLVVETGGPRFFWDATEGVVGVDIDPESQGAVYLHEHQLPQVRRWAQALEVEAIVSGEANPPDAFERLLRYEGYWVLVRRSEQADVPEMALAPDHEGRKLAAVFTAEDTLDRFLEVHGEDTTPPITVDGHTLFQRLQAMPLDGIVFNCAGGPVPPKALAPDFVRVVLQKQQGDQRT